VPSKQAFDVDLAALLRVFGGHLYSTPAVFARELVQNALDAVRIEIEASSSGLRKAGSQSTSARPSYVPSIVVAVDPEAGVVTFTDNGIGLDADGLRDHLSRVGASSKRKADRKNVVGQFGIGLLSGFLVADELVVHTKTAKGPALVWRAKASGTYEVSEGDAELLRSGQQEGAEEAHGTHVIVKLRKDARHYAEPAHMRDLLETYVPHVAVPVALKVGEVARVVTRPGIWALEGAAQQQAIVEKIGAPPLAVIPIRADAGEGVLWIRSDATALAQPTLSLYHHGILVEPAGSGLLPRWAGFVGGVLNASGLAPTASREGFVRDAAWDALKTHLSSELIGFLAALPDRDEEGMVRLLEAHRTHVLAACIDDPALLAAFGGQIPLDSNRGITSLDREAANPEVLFTTSPSDYSVAAAVSAGRDLTLLNATHTHEKEFLAAWSRVTARPPLRELAIREIDAWFTDAREQQQRFAALLAEAAKLLAPLRVEPQLRSFEPTDVPALLLADDTNLAARADEVAASGSALSRSLVSGLSVRQRVPLTPLVLNVHNPLVASLPELVHPELGGRVVRMLYTQAAQRLRRVPTSVDNRSFASDLLFVLRGTTTTTRTPHGSNSHH
jgi:molecular chaperone HtpG